MVKPKKDEKDEPAFEASLERLEQIVSEMEGGELPLERAMALFEEGVALGRRCNVELDAAEKRISILLERSDGEVEERDFDPRADAVESRPAPRKATPEPRKPQPRASKPPSTDELDDDDDEIPF